MSGPATISVHANAVAIADRGVLIRGPSGSGKSALSLALLEAARLRGLYGALVADDRVRLEAAHGRIVASGVPDFAGLIESRGEGLIRVRSESEVVVRLIVDLIAAGQRLPRYPEASARSVEVVGVTAPALDLDFTVNPWSSVAATMRKLGFDSP